MSGSYYYTHPEGVLSGLTRHDWQYWPLSRYNTCLENETVLNKCMDQAYKMASHFPPTTAEGEKWALRYRGLQLLRDVDNAVEME